MSLDMPPPPGQRIIKGVNAYQEQWGGGGRGKLPQAVGRTGQSSMGR